MALTLDTADNKVFIKSLTWKGKPVITDDPSYRFYLHSDAGTMPAAPPAFGKAATKWTSDFQVYKGSMYGVPKMPWQANQTTWQTQMPPDIQEYSATITSTILSQNATTIVINTSSASIQIIDTIRLDVDPDSLYITQNITNLLPENATAYTGLHLPNLQVGSASSGCACPAVIWSGGPGTRADGHGQANNCTANCNTKLYHLDGLRRGAIQQGQPFDNMVAPCPPQSALPGWRTVAARGNAYPESIFSPATSLGAVGAFTLGLQLLDPNTNPDTTATVQVEYYDIPAAPKKPLVSQYIAVALPANGERAFTSVLTLAPAATSWATPLPAVAASLKPYASFFGKQYGSKPAYCPSGAINAQFEQNEANFNRTYCKEPGCETYKPGSSFYHDDLQLDRALPVSVPAGMDKLIIWQGQIFSSLITEGFTQYEFNPNSDILDPNLDQCCKGPWTNVTDTMKKAGVGLGWFGRPCSHIMRTDDPTKSASMDCPSKVIHKGVPVPCDLQDLQQPCSAASMATVDALVKNGVTSFYWDSYLCEGRMTFSQAVMKKYPHLFIMGEQGVDVDSTVISGLPWMGMQAGVWDPGFEPLNSVLQTIVNPLGTAMVGGFGADQNINHTTYSLSASKSNSLLIFMWSNSSGPPGSMGAINKAIYCNQIQMSYSNTLWRMQQYGTAAGCTAPLKPDLAALRCPPASSGIYIDVEKLPDGASFADSVAEALANAVQAGSLSEKELMGNA